MAVAAAFAVNSIRRTALTSSSLSSVGCSDSIPAASAIAVVALHPVAGRKSRQCTVCKGGTASAACAAQSIDSGGSQVAFRSSVKSCSRLKDSNARSNRELTSRCNSSANVPPDDVAASETSAFDARESEDVARERNWKERGWAPWEEMLTPEAQFAIDSLASGDEEPAVSWEVFRKLNKQTDVKEVMKEPEEAAQKREEERTKAFTSDKTLWDLPLVFTLTPPRDWPPPGWKVDPKELAYIREAHTLANRKLWPEDLEESKLRPEDEDFGVPRWKMFLKQYNEWVAANRDRLEREAIEVDGEYYPGRRRTGEDYKEDMFELPMIYPGQHYFAVVTYVSLYEGAFVDYGGVHEGWIPIMDNDWYEIRHHIKVGMKVHVEVMAKRDPYRFRFPVEMRFVDPNIDHLIFRRFKYPPIFGREEDTNLDEVAREANRPFYPKLRPEVIPGEEETEADVHPFVRRLWIVHEAEQMLLEDEDGMHDNEKWDDWATEEEEDPTGEWSSEPGMLEESMEDAPFPTIVVPVDEKYVDLEAARVEFEAVKKLYLEAEARGEEFEEPEGRFHKRVKELNDMHQQRWTEEIEAFIRDRACCLELGLPIEEPGRYADKSFWGKNLYDPLDPLWRHDYWGDPSTVKDEIKKEREPRVRPEATEADDRDDVLDDMEADVPITTAEGKNDRRITYDDADARMILGESEDTVLNGTAAKSISKGQDVYEVEEGDWTVEDVTDGKDSEDEGDDGKVEE